LSDITGFSQQGGNQGWSDADPTRIRQIEYGIAENDIQNRFALSLNYELQYRKEFTDIKKAFLSGWQTNMITAWQSGKPFIIVNTGASADNPVKSDAKQHGFNNRAPPQNSWGQDRPNQTGDARLSHKTLSQFFDTTKFAPQPLGTVGTTQRNSLFGPDFRHVDLSLFKIFLSRNVSTCSSAWKASISPTRPTSPSVTAAAAQASTTLPSEAFLRPIRTVPRGSINSRSKGSSNLRQHPALRRGKTSSPKDRFGPIPSELMKVIH
jgi:hypothetical protein